MKKLLITAIFIATTFVGYSQASGYQDLGVLFSKDDQTGTARFMGMSGAFGAVGGDISAININPAGIGIFATSMFSGSFNSRDTEIATSYYGNTNKTKDDYFNVSNAGAVLVFDSAYDSTNWTKFAIGVNYRIKKDFSNSFLAQGNSGTPTFRDFPKDQNNPAIQYDFSDEQNFRNRYAGDISEFTFAFAGVHQNKLYVGAGLNFLTLEFSQKAYLAEKNNDGNGNTLNTEFYQQNYTTGAGFSLNLGAIYKVTNNFRLGLAYQTPTWFSELIEDSNIIDNDGFFGDTNISVSEDPNNSYSNNAGNYYPSQSFIYQLKTPGKLTASASYIFGSNGLISIDYVNKNYKNIKLSDEIDFSTENQFFQNNLRNTYLLNIGTEWRIDRFSIRGGYNYEESPYSDAIDAENINGYSFGGGYNFGNFKVDFAYSNSNRKDFYNFYSQFNNINASELNIDNSVFTATVSINL